MNDQKQKLGVSGFLPPVASACLVRAAADARRVAWDNSLRRAKIIDAAIRKVKLEYPRYFRAPDDCSCERQRTGNLRPSTLSVGGRVENVFEEVVRC